MTSFPDYIADNAISDSLASFFLGSGGIPGTTGLSKSNTARFRALAKTPLSRNLRIVFDGESVIRGQSTGVGTAQAINAMPFKLAALMTSAYGIASGSNNVWCDGGSWGLGQTIANYLTGDGRSSVTGAWALGSGKSPGGNSFQCAAAGSMTFTPQGNFDTVNVFWRDAVVGRNITCQIGADAPVAINSTGTTQLAMTTITASGGVGSYAITLTWVAGTAGAIAISAYDSTRKEWTFWDWGICGVTTAGLIDNSDTAVGRIACISNSLTKPDLIFIESMVNDWATSVAVATSQSNLDSLASTTVAQCDTILLVPPFDNRNIGNSANQQQYINAIYSVAANHNLPVYDIRKRWGSIGNAIALGFQVTNDPHPTTAGYADWAAGLQLVLNYART